jgi:hypothetical protein
VKRGGEEPLMVTIQSEPNSQSVMETLKMAVKQDRFRDTARMMLEPWLVQAALTRLGDRQLALDEQTEVMRATRTRHRVRWPDWWEAK